MTKEDNIEEIMNSIKGLPDKYGPIKKNFDMDLFIRKIYTHHKEGVNLYKKLALYLEDLSIEYGCFISVRKLLDYLEVKDSSNLMKLKKSLLQNNIIKPRDKSHIIKEAGDLLIMLQRLNVISGEELQKAIICVREIILKKEIYVKSNYALKYSYAAICKIKEFETYDMAGIFADRLGGYAVDYYQIFYRVENQLEYVNTQNTTKISVPQAS